jgi:hypothetical protein
MTAARRRAQSWRRTRLLNFLRHRDIYRRLVALSFAFLIQHGLLILRALDLLQSGLVAGFAASV